MRYRGSSEDGSSGIVAESLMKSVQKPSDQSGQFLELGGKLFQVNSPDSIRDNLLAIFLEAYRSGKHEVFNNTWIKVRDVILPELIKNGFQLPTGNLTVLGDKKFASPEDLYLYAVIGQTTTPSPQIQKTVNLDEGNGMMIMAEAARKVVNSNGKDRTTQSLIQSVGTLMARTVQN